MFLQYLSPCRMFPESTILEIFQIYKVTMLRRIFTDLQLLNTVLHVMYLLTLNCFRMVLFWYPQFPTFFMGIQPLYGYTPSATYKVWGFWNILRVSKVYSSTILYHCYKEKSQTKTKKQTQNLDVALKIPGPSWQKRALFTCMFVCFKPRFLVSTKDSGTAHITKQISWTSSNCLSAFYCVCLLWST